MKPQEIRMIGMWKQFLFIPHLLPILCTKVRYFLLPVFVNRLKEISPSLAALGKALPTKQQLEDAASKGELRAAVPLLKIEHTEYVFAPKPAETEVTPDAKEPAAERPLNAADVEGLNSLTADDFSCDFSDIEVPSEKPTDAELQAGVDQLLARFGM
jgi:type IV secretion system protein VirD4